MDMSGEFRIPASREAVWKALNDPEILKQCIPGCEELTKNSDTEFVARVVAKVGPVKAGFSGKVTLSDLDPPNGYKITGEGQGGAAGFAKGGADVRLEPDGNGTLLKYTVNAAIGGKLAQIGARLVDGSAARWPRIFFCEIRPATSRRANLRQCASPRWMKSRLNPHSTTTRRRHLLPMRHRQR